MTEEGILHALGCCRAKNCASCNFFRENDCSAKMMATAQQIITLQKERLEFGSGELEKLETTNRQLQGACRYTFTEDSLVKAVNEIVHYCMDNDEDEEGNRDVNIIRAMLDLTKLLPSKYKLVIRPGYDAPEIHFDK